MAGAGVARGQELQFRRLTPDDGLASSRVHDIAQDGRGFVWVGTDKGLSRYDGYTFVNYRRSTRDRDSLPHEYVEGLYVDRAGTLWVGSRGGLSRYEPARDAFTTFLRDSSDDASTRRAILCMLEDRRGAFWVGTTGGLARLDRRTGQVTEVLFTPDATYSGEYVNALAEDVDGRLWIGTLRSGAYRYDPRTGAVESFRPDPVEPRSLPGRDVRAFALDARGTMWIGTYDGGLARFDRASGRIEPRRYAAPGDTITGDKRIRRLMADRVRGIWIGTEDDGVEFLDTETGQARRYLSQLGNPWTLNNNSVWALHQEPGGTIWAGTFAGGVNVSKQNSRAIHLFRNVPGLVGSLSNDVVRGFAEDREGVIWVATDGGGLNRFDRRTGQFSEFTSWNTNLNRAGVLAVAVDARNAVWVGTWSGGISRFDAATRRFTAFTSANSELPEDNVFSLLFDRRGRLWVGTLQSGLARFDPSTGRAVRYLVPRTGAGPTVRRIEEAKDGRLLVALEGGGLAVLDPETGATRIHRWEPQQATALASSSIYAVHESEPNVVWIGTDAGLDRLDLRTARVTHLSTRDGLPGERVFGVTTDARGTVWISTDRGIGRYDPRTGRVDAYLAADGLQGTEFNASAYFRARDGSIFFGGSSGFNVIQPALIVRNERAPRVVLTGFQLFNRRVPIGEAGSPLTSHISTMRHLTLAPDQSVFTLEFVALDFAAPSKNRYAYRLEGFDADWVQAGAARSATYTNLPPGDYVFRVRAANADGVWNEAGTSLRITIRPPVWRTWWFLTLALLAMGGAAAVVSRNARRRRRRLEAMNARLEEANARLGQASERDRASQQYLERNVMEMLEAMQRFSAGDHSLALAVTTDDEIGRLRRGFNTVVADRKRTEEELRQSQKMDAVGRLAGGIAHDFNNLLTVIKGNTELALEALPDSDPVRTDLADVQRAAQRAASLTRQLLAFSRKQVLQPRLLRLDDVVSEVSRMLERTVGEDVRLHIALSADAAHVRADPGQLEQVLLNLVLNARDAMPRGGDLWIETREVDAPDASDAERAAAPMRPYVALAVRDTGIGMRPEVRERAFEPFFTTKEVGKGTGLGLSTVYGIVAQSGGFVQASSTVGAGSTFTVYLPRVAEEGVTEDAAPLAAQPRGSETVLVAEDEPGVRQLVCAVLERAGYTVLRAADGSEALDLASAHVGRIDLLLTDVVMPGMSGRELAERLLPGRPATRVLFMSGYTEDAVVLHGVSTLGTAFLPKPFTPDVLARTVRAVLDEPAAERASDSQSVAAD
ncbi:MAG TPA: two-component regulator propeller domain-containing protein [Gemmatimonadaceae bacterium]|nr:two-component regulator propeller domain-containing protein [Gemmatimonadaceae bacterium]